MPTAQGSFTYGEVISDIKTPLQELYPKVMTDKIFTKKIMLKLIYKVICELNELAGDKDDPKYREKTVLTPSSNAGGLVPYSSGCTYTNSSKTVYIPSVLWEGGYFSTGLTDATKLSQGAIVIFYLPVGGANVWASTIASITDATHFVLTDAYGGNLASAEFSVAVLVPGTSSADDIDLTAITDYKYIDKITSIYDSVNGLCIEVPEDTFHSLTKMTSTDNNMSDTVVYFRAGGYIYMKKFSLTAYGTRTIYYIRFPIKPTLTTEYVDIPDTQQKLLSDIVSVYILQSHKISIPDLYRSSYSKLMEMKKQTAEEKAKLSEGMKTSGQN